MTPAPPELPDLGVVIKSCKKDLCWLHYCLAFLDKNWVDDEPLELHVILDEDCRPQMRDFQQDEKEEEPQKLLMHWHYVAPWPDRYCHAMYQKLLADDYSPADLLWLLDSDTMVLQPINRAALL